MNDAQDDSSHEGPPDYVGSDATQRRFIWGRAIIAFLPICFGVSLLQAVFIDPLLTENNVNNNLVGIVVLGCNLGLSCYLAARLTMSSDNTR